MQNQLQFPTTAFIPRGYQTRAAIEIFKSLRNGHHPVAVAATGLGKTTVIGMVCRDYPGRILVLTHLLVIHQQLLDRISEFAPTGVIYGSRTDSDRVLISPVATMNRRLSKFDPGEFDLIIVDEVHRAQTDEYSNIFTHFRCSRLGFTATPDEVTQHFDEFAVDLPMPWAIGDGWLVPMRIRSMAENTEPGRVALTVSGLSGPSIVFSENVAHGRQIVQAMRYLGMTAEIVTAESNHSHRDMVIRDFRAGKITALVNYGVIAEGFDASAAHNIVIARRVTKRHIFAQMVGRGLRPTAKITDDMGPVGRKQAIAASDKPFCTIVDFGNNAIMHDLTSYNPSERRSAAGKKMIDAMEPRPYSGDLFDAYKNDDSYRRFFEVAAQYNMGDDELRRLLCLSPAPKPDAR